MDARRQVGDVRVRTRERDPERRAAILDRAARGWCRAATDAPSRVPGEDLAGRLYDLILPGTTRDGIINEALQKRSIENVIERVGVKEAPPLDRMYNFSLARKVRDELTVKGWKP